MEDLFGNDNFLKTLEQLDFPVENDLSKSPLLLIKHLDTDRSNLDPYQITALEKAKIFSATAVYFRYFEQRPPQAQIYIYDNTSGQFLNKYPEIHRDLWSSCEIPISILIDKTQIKIFDCRKPVTYNSSLKSINVKSVHDIELKKLELYDNILKLYSRFQFDNGAFWESEEAQRNYRIEKTPYKVLLEGFKKIREDSTRFRSLGISKSQFDKLLIVCILIKYLEENGIDKNNRNLAADFFYTHTSYYNLADILRNGKTIDLLKALSKHFNGGVFDIGDNEFSESLKNKKLPLLAEYLDANIDHQFNFVVWKQYSFKYIPVELISNIYEEFLPKEKTGSKTEKGAVYTPNHLVSFLIDESLPLINTDYSVKSIDISCGSGIFLVGTFKRLVQRYLIKYNYPKIDAKILQEIISNNIFGIDINPDAVNLSKFSLALSVCQLLSPKQIWTELKFIDFGNNIKSKDFFEFVSEEENQKKFDLVIGNPPFNPPTDENGNDILKSKYYDDIIDKYHFHIPEIGDKSTSILFMELSLNLLSKNGLLCLVQQAIPLLHTNNNLGYRKYFFEKRHVLQIIDFSLLRRTLFPMATTPSVVVFIRNNKKKDETLLHAVVRRTKSTEEKLYFEFDSYDLHRIHINDTLDNTRWKSNLYGGGRIYDLMKRLRELPKISELWEGKIKPKAGWPLKVIQQSNKGFFVSKKITHGFFPEIVEPANYTPENWGIVSKGNHDNVIDYLKKYFLSNTKLLTAYIAATSTRQGLDRPYNVNTNDISQLPLLKNRALLSKADKIVIEDICNYRISEIGLGENADINKIIIDESLKNKLLSDFSETFCEVLNSIYGRPNKEFFLKTFTVGPSYFACRFEFDQIDKSISYSTSKSFDYLLGDYKKNNYIVKRILKIYGSDGSITLIKPKQIRYWLKSIALQDADESIKDILEAGIENQC